MFDLEMREVRIVLRCRDDKCDVTKLYRMTDAALRLWFGTIAQELPWNVSRIRLISEVD